MKNKRGQLIILAALILSAVLISFNVTQNYIRIQDEPKEFYDLIYEIKEESMNVVDYGVYSGEVSALPDFLNQTKTNLEGIDPEMEIIYIYGDSNEVFVVNNAKQDLTVGGEETVVHKGRSETKSVISFSDFQILVKQSVETPSSHSASFSGKDKLEIKLNDIPYEFQLGQDDIFYLITIKRSNNETYIAMP
ncbi:MAG: hypothetical protein ACOYT4_05175 [Nanoarchaeota archaeon]